MINTFQSKVLKFEILTRSMNIPEFKRDITKENIIWLKKNLEWKNKNHKNFNEAMDMINDFYNRLYSTGKLI